MFDTKKLDEYLRALYEKKELPGVSVCLMGPEGIVFEKGYGYRNEDGSLPVDGDTVFGIASMSKSMVALAFCLLEAEGKLSIDDPVYFHYPGFELPGTPRDTVTLRHLMMHTSGLPPIEPLAWSISMNTPGLDNEWSRAARASAKSKMESIEQLVDYIKSCPYELLGSPGEYMSYCNDGYAVLSYAFDNASGTTLESFLKEHVFQPLGMSRSILDVDCAEAREMADGNITSLFEREEGKLVCDDKWSILPPYRGCGLVKSTAKDMAAYYRCLSNDGVHEGKQVWPAGAVRRMIGREFPETEKQVYCLGLTKRLYKGTVICEHGGGLHGVSSNGALLYGEGYGFSVLCNQGDADVEPFTWAMMNAVMGLPLETSQQWLRPIGRAFGEPEALVGTYRGHEEGEPTDVKVYVKDNEPYALLNKEEYKLIYCGGAAFQGYQKAEDAPKMRFEFYIRGGSAWGAKMGSRIFQRVSI